LEGPYNYRGGTKQVKKRIAEKSPKVQEEFTGKGMTGFGGTGLIRRFIKRHQVEKELEEGLVIEGRRESRYSPAQLLVGVLYGIFLGYCRPGQMKVLVKDQVFQKLAGFKGFPVQSTLSRFFGGLKVAVAHQIGQVSFDQLLSFRKQFRGWFRITLDLDSHVTSVYGKQQRTGLGYNPKKKGRKSYHPLFCFIGETRDYLAGLLRSGVHHTSYKSEEFLKAILKKLPTHIKKIRLRADSGFFGTEFINFLISRKIEFYIAVPLQPWVQRQIVGLTDWRSIGKGVEVNQWPMVLGADVLWMAVVRKKVKAGESPKKQLSLLKGCPELFDYQVISTNSFITPEEVWRFYNKRACCENFIKEGIYGFGMDKVISHSYAGNYAYLELLMLGYNLMNFFKEEVLKQKKVKEMVQSIREKIFRVPGKMIYTGRCWILKLERTWYAQVEFEEALARVG
jgi:hypothetical protein